MEPETVLEGSRMAPESIVPCRQNPRNRRETSPARSEASRRNGAKSTGRPRALVDMAKVHRLCFEGSTTGATVESIARKLGVSVRTLKRRAQEQCGGNEQ